MGGGGGGQVNRKQFGSQFLDDQKLPPTPAPHPHPLGKGGGLHGQFGTDKKIPPPSCEQKEGQTR